MTEVACEACDLSSCTWMGCSHVEVGRQCVHAVDTCTNTCYLVINLHWLSSYVVVASG
jgi:hypothetical protein